MGNKILILTVALVLVGWGLVLNNKVNSSVQYVPPVSVGTATTPVNMRWKRDVTTKLRFNDVQGSYNDPQITLNSVWY